MFPTLSTDRLVLREIFQEDAEAIYSYFSDDRVTKHYGMNTFTNLEEAENLINAFSSNFTQKRGIRWGIERKNKKGLIGTIGFNLWSPAHKRAEIGYEIHPDFWRLGYTSEALMAIVDYGFNELGLTRIGAVVFIENHASNQLLLSNGFEKEGILKKYIYQNNIAYDVNMFSIVK
ncbi:MULTISPECIES: GNAT family N-acetyltransferase [Solibacillus]|uniref:GNAT family N-acetyltransferase n=1 Tax=Solibacillus merdavium TaxID=2762218 RepID=A0ABR8XN74_9BACL|nr:GNAT family protein [Solibacillus merdavium]MBD8033388.1 GNAT family N-acetyltransferase [Solibacillus merdavium]